jgi:hypothetical protein
MNQEIWFLLEEFINSYNVVMDADYLSYLEKRDNIHLLMDDFCKTVLEIAKGQ